MAYDELGVTGYGVAEAADAAAQHLRLPLGGARVAIQGFGAVGHAAAGRFAELGATVVAVSTAEGALHDPARLDVPALRAAREEHGDDFVTRHHHGVVIPPGQELTAGGTARANAVTVLEEAQRRATTPHIAGRGLAEDRVRAAMRSKGRIGR
nr:hypothetical protein [Streptomyces sabulosicollis]